MYEKIMNLVAKTIQANKEPFALFLKNKVGHLSLQVLKQEEVMGMIASRIHGYLPFFVRIFLREKRFVGIFMSNKDRALHLLEPLIETSTKKADRAFPYHSAERGDFLTQGKNKA